MAINVIYNIESGMKNMECNQASTKANIIDAAYFASLRYFLMVILDEDEVLFLGMDCACV